MCLSSEGQAKTEKNTRRRSPGTMINSVASGDVKEVMGDVARIGDATEIIQVLSRVLTQLIDLNRNATSKHQVITKFQSSYPPAISIVAYLERINKYAKCSPNCFIIALIYIDRLIETRNVILSTLNVHRILITSVLLATKVFDDEFYKNAYYAKLGGVSTQEMNSLELEFISLMNFDFYVTQDTFEKYQKELTAFVVAPCPTMDSSQLETPVVDAVAGERLSTPSPPVLLSCGQYKASSIHMHHLLSAPGSSALSLGGLGQVRSQQHFSPGDSRDSSEVTTMSNVVVPLSFDSQSSFVTITPPLISEQSTQARAQASALESVMNCQVDGGYFEDKETGPEGPTPQLVSSISHQSYFSCRPSLSQQQQMAAACQGGNGFYIHPQQPPPVSQFFDSHISSVPVMKTPQRNHHLGGGNRYGMQHQAAYYPPGGNGHELVTTPTSVADGAFAWDSVGINSGVAGQHDQLKQHQQQQQIQQNQTLFPANFYHPAHHRHQPPQATNVFFPPQPQQHPQQQLSNHFSTQPFSAIPSCMMDSQRGHQVYNHSQQQPSPMHQYRQKQHCHPSQGFAMHAPQQHFVAATGGYPSAFWSSDASG